jgi:hypothetical protein
MASVAASTMLLNLWTSVDGKNAQPPCVPAQR